MGLSLLLHFECSLLQWQHLLPGCFPLAFQVETDSGCICHAQTSSYPSLELAVLRLTHNHPGQSLLSVPAGGDCMQLSCARPRPGWMPLACCISSFLSRSQEAPGLKGNLHHVFLKFWYSFLSQFLLATGYHILFCDLCLHIYCWLWKW